MSIKLICTDMDGTLLKDQKIISKKNLEAIDKAINKDIIVAITTGRVYKSAKLYADEIGLKTPIIALNGAYIGDSNGETIYKNPLTKEMAREFFEVSVKCGLNPYFTTEFGIISKGELPETHVYKIINKELEKEKQIELIVMDDIEEILSKYGDELLKGVCADKNNMEKVLEARNIIENSDIEKEVVSSWPDNFEIMNIGSSKGEAVKKLAEYLKIDLKDVMCIGDSENDISMIKCAGVGVAMGNGTEDVKLASDFITDTNINDGVSKAIETFI
ncbi:MAG: Cof-type HAD-IIB family hydrolase [Clostridium sp.]|uniref:Cof-type HAD-IIB family hydrolase n=1 Tax=Clostridium chrysemydis TaxID=2665504 RepID=UPI003EE4DAC9